MPKRYPSGLLLALVLLLSFSAATALAEEYAPALLVGPHGKSVTLPLAPDIWRTYAGQVTDSGRALLLSDNPEYVSEPGIMYRDTVDGPARLYLYHATRGGRALRYGIILRNNTERDITVTTTRKGTGGPSTGYATLGQTVLVRFWESLLDEKLVVPAGEQRHLDPDIIYLAALNDALVHGIYDIETDGPLEVAFVADDDFLRLREPNLDHYTDFIRPAGERMRGTFATSERHITFPVGDRRTTLSFAGNFPPDLYLWGVDGVDGTPRQDYGNYGVTYHLNIPIKVTEPRRVRLYLSPAFSNAGSCALYSTIMLTDGEHDDHSEVGRVIRMPGSKEQVHAGLIGETVVIPGDPRIVRLDFNPPGGSCLPALLHAEPEAITMDEALAWYSINDRADDSKDPLPTSASGQRVLPKGVLYYDNFTDEQGGWQWSENWPTYQSDQLVIDTFGFTNGFAGDREWRDYAMEMRFRIDELGQYGGMRLYVRNQQLWVSYGILFGPTGTYVDRLEGAWDHHQRYAVIGREDARVQEGVWYTVRVEVVGNEIRVSKDGQSLVTIKDPDNMYPKGNIGFRTENSRITIDYIRVDEIDR